jgi:hypothetical protein
MSLLEAMARQEGLYHLFAKAYAATDSGKRLAISPTTNQAGFACVAALLWEQFRGCTIRQMVYKWLGLPSEPTDYPEAYIAHVCEWTGLLNSEVIDSHLEVPA